MLPGWVCQIGVMLTDTVIDAMVVGGPAANSGLIHKGDRIISVDGRDMSNVAADDLHSALVGSDQPGTKVGGGGQLVSAAT